jgi:VIT1/CCC1 family predicted Fe2+/Mn2+ transporter
MVMTFTGSIQVAEGGKAELRTVLLAALGCNLAWGIADAAMYLVSNFTERARGVATLRALRQTGEREAAHRLILDAVPAPLANVLTPAEVEGLRQRLNDQPEMTPVVRLSGADFAGAAAVFLLVFLSTLPIAIPFVVIQQPAAALRTSNAIAIVMLFITGWSLGHASGRPGWRTGLGMVTVGVVLVGIMMALGG